MNTKFESLTKLMADNTRSINEQIASTAKQTKTEVLAEIGSVRAAVEGLSTRVKTLEDNLTNITTRSDTNRTDIKDATAKIEENQENIDNLFQQIDDLRYALDEQQDRNMRDTLIIKGVDRGQIQTSCYHKNLQN